MKVTGRVEGRGHTYWDLGAHTGTLADEDDQDALPDSVNMSRGDVLLTRLEHRRACPSWSYPQTRTTAIQLSCSWVRERSMG